LLNFLFEAKQIVIAEKVHVFAFSDIATSRKLLCHQLQLITSSRSSILSPVRELNNLLFESVDLAGARRLDSLELIQSPTKSTKQERRRAYLRKRNTRLYFF